MKPAEGGRHNGNACCKKAGSDRCVVLRYATSGMSQGIGKRLSDIWQQLFWKRNNPFNKTREKVPMTKEERALGR